jgi:uncharacterized membrane protein YdjX (TVP38/TMEM64 family)
MKKKTSHYKLSRKTIFSLLAILLIFAALSFAMLPLIRLLSNENGQAILAEKMQSFGIFAPLLFVLLQVIQVVIAIIPGGPIPIIGGILFGKWGALFLSLTGFFLGTVLVYYLVQWIGRPLVDRFVSEKHFKKFEFLHNSKHLEWLILVIFLLPGLPKDVLTYLVSFDTKIKPMHLFLLTTIGRTPATILTVFLGDSLLEGNYTLTVILTGILILLAVIGYAIKKKLDHRQHRRKNIR